MIIKYCGWLRIRSARTNWCKTTKCQGNLMDQSLQCSLPASAALTAGSGKAVPIRSVRNTAGENCSWISPSETNFTANSLSHHNTFVMAAFVMDDLHSHYIKSVQSGKAMG